MKNYTVLKKRLELCLIHLETLKEQKEVLNSFLSPKTFKISPVINKGGQVEDPFVIYTYEIINIDKQIEIVKKEINLLQKNMKKMENVLRNIDGSMYKICV